ncbi:hypothetical protein ACHAW5_000180 [Stephanodiscus triporus]|uniref:Heme O synthase n=1 Tax=Stephanodiscus triporus TaxID=2934178 RepID=A0ABD3Q2Q2_9STRA
MTGGVILSCCQVHNYWRSAIRRSNRPRAAGIVRRRVCPSHNARDAGRRFSTSATDGNAQRNTINKVASDDGTPPADSQINAASGNSLASNLAELSKARLSALVVSTTAFGFLSAGPTALAFTSLPTFFAASVGTAMCASSAATFNQVIEVERDGRMKRTSNRPLVTGAVSKDVAVGLGCLTGASGGLILGLGTDPVTTALGIGNIGLYAGMYTYLKPRSEINTWIGAVVGAIPPVMGWTAAGGSITDPEAVLLGTTLFLWQFPHFFALNWMYRADYKRGGFSMVAVNDPNGDRTAGLIKRYGMYLASLPFISAALEVTSPMFAVDAGILLNGYALHVASEFDKERSNANARKVFLTSLWYLPCVMMLFLLHSRRWHEEVTDDNKSTLKNGDVGDVSLLVSMQKLMNEIQAKGRELCMHEAIASKDIGLWLGSDSSKIAIDGSKCPIAIGKAAASSSIATKEALELKQESSQEESPSNESSLSIPTIARALGLDAPTKSRPSTDRGSGRDPGGGTRGRVIRTAVRPFQEGGGSIPSSASYTTRKTSMPAIIVSEAGAVGDYNHHRTSALRSTPDRAISILTGDVGSYVRSLDGGYFADDGVWNDDSDDGGDDGRRGYRDGDLGENVLVDGVDFDYFEVGMRYRFSSSTSSLNGGDGDAATTATTISEEGVVVEITEPMEPCANLCKLPYVNDPSLEPRHRVARCQYFLEALWQREGLRGWYAKVVRGGVVRVGDSLMFAVAPA